MKKLVIALGILSACANSDAMQDYFKGTSRSANEFRMNEDHADANERLSFSARMYLRDGNVCLELANCTNQQLHIMLRYPQRYLRDLIIAPDITEIRSNFRDYIALVNLLFEEGSNLKSIGWNAFAETSIKHLTIPSSVEVLDDGCFFGVELEVLQFEEGSMLRRIGKFAFYDNNLSEITLPDSVQVLGEMSFYQAGRDSFVVNITVGSQLSDVGARVFPPYAEIIDASGRVLSRPDFNPHPQIIMGSNLYWRANTWIRNRGDKILEIPNTIQKIDDRCCQEMRFDRVVFAPGSQVKVLGKKLFFNGGIYSPLRIPDSVEEIRKMCFCDMADDSENFAIIFGPKSNLQTVGKDAFECTISGGIIVHSKRVYDLIYQNLAETYGEVEEEGPNKKKRLSSEAPRLILESEEKSSSKE